MAATLKIDFEILDLSQPLYLDFNADPGLLKSLVVNGASQKIDHRQEHLILAHGLHLGKNSLEIQFDAGEQSLNRNGDFLYTLLVPERARTFFPCFDQPDIKARYHLEVLAPKDWQVLSGAPLEERILEGDLMRHRFAESDLMSSYLFSLVAGKFQRSRENPGIFDMEFLYRETDTAKIKASMTRIYDLHQRSIDFLMGYTEHEFPFRKLDFVALPGFQYGGMEHIGAIQYNQASLFLDESATRRQRMSRAKLIAHETAHMWFGDLVTMVWFDDVWMKEVFANFMADKIVNPTFADVDHALQFMTSHYPSAYAEDRTHGSNPIQQPLGNLNKAGSLYGGIIYNKAPIMMRQLETAMGEWEFRKGIRQYIAKYAYGNASWDDLVDILDGISGLDLRSWSEVWVKRAGRPIFTEHLALEGETIKSLFLTQRAEDGSDNLWPQSFEVSLVYADSVERIPVTIKGKRVEIPEARGLPRPKAIFYNSNALGYGLFPMRAPDLPLIHGLQDAVARGYAYLNAYENILACNLETDRGMEIFGLGLRTETDELIHGLLCEQMGKLFWKYLTPEERVGKQAFLEPMLWRELVSGEHSPNIKKNLYGLWKGLAYSASAKERLHALWKGDIQVPGLRLNEDDHTDMAMSLALYGHGEAGAILETAREKLSNADKLERFDFLLPSLSADETIRDAFFESLKEPQMREKEAWAITATSYIHHPLRQPRAQKHLPQALEMLEEIHRTGDIFFPKRWLVASIGQYQSQEAQDLVEEYLEAHPDLDASLRGKLLQATDDLHRFLVQSEVN